MFLLRKRRASIVETLRSRLGADRIVAMDDRANFVGAESEGSLKIRGSGCLAASDEEILFIMLIFGREISIRRDRITAVERATTHVGRTFATPLLRIQFVDGEGKSDAAAWRVQELAAWESTLARDGR